MQIAELYAHGVILYVLGKNQTSVEKVVFPPPPPCSGGENHTYALKLLEIMTDWHVQNVCIFLGSWFKLLVIMTNWHVH